MESINFTDRIIDCITEAHQFSINLGSSTSITRDYIVEKLKDISATDIHISLLEMNDKKIINYNSDTGLILILN